MITTARGAKTYNTGKPCKRGHLSDRYISGRSCVVCVCERVTPWQSANPEKVRQSTQRYNTANRESRLEKCKIGMRKYRARLRRERLLQNTQQENI